MVDQAYTVDEILHAPGQADVVLPACLFVPYGFLTRNKKVHRNQTC